MLKISGNCQGKDKHNTRGVRKKMEWRTYRGSGSAWDKEKPFVCEEDKTLNITPRKKEGKK